MLTRAARRRHALRCIERAAENLQLPWLCPVLSTPSPLAEQRRTTTTRPSPSRSPRSIPQNQHPRTLASAASITDPFGSHDDYLPFAYERHSSPAPTRREDPLGFDISDILMFDQTTILPPQRASSLTSTESRGNALEIEATLEACLQVQRWDRAFHMLKQLNKLLVGNTSKLQQMYNRVLEAMVFDLIWNRNTQNQDSINQWVEVHMKNAGIEPNAQTFALKIKAALTTLEGSRRHRTVTRYWEMAKHYQFENHVASLRNILSDSDLGKLTEICPLKIEFELDTEKMQEDEDALAETQATMGGSSNFVRETDQKGLGLVALRQSLASFQDLKENPTNIEEEAAFSHQRQLKLERDSLQSAVDRWQIEHERRMKMGVSGSTQHGKVGALMWQWHERLAQKIKQELEVVEEAESRSKHTVEDRLRCEYGPFLRLLSLQQLAALTTISVVQIMSKMGVGSDVKAARLVTEVGRAVEDEVESIRKKAKKSVKKPKLKSANTESVADAPSTELNLHQSALQESPRWTNVTRAKVGAILCELLFDIAKIPVDQEGSKSAKKSPSVEPVFHRQLAYVHGRRVATISLHASFRELMMQHPVADLIAKQMPMVSKPKPWTGFSNGGYLETTQPVLRVKFNDEAQRDYAKAAAERGDLDQLFEGLDVLGSTGWKINQDVFNVMLAAWNSGEGIAKIPALNQDFPEVEKPSPDASQLEKWAYYGKMRAIENAKSGSHSNRCFQNFQMEVARSYLGETFYLPHNVDFRGRAYPIPPYLNQMGADNARGLLLFANGRALGPDGLRWLQVHLANVYGYDKASLSDRAQFALDHMDDIRDAVQNPLNGKRWWLKAEDPWQCLATCHELVKAIDSSDPTTYVSYLPIHQDGTCNGLQHYAALGGDTAGARQVNLIPGDKPADVYTGVAELVKAEIAQDAKEGLEIAQLLDGRITRKIVKQTVMTNVYGVTFTGAIRQVRKQVDDILPDLNESGKAGQAATYIARKIFKGLGTLFEGAHEIQYWLGDCAQRITHSISPAQLEQLEKKEFEKVKAQETSNVSSRKKKEKSDKIIDAANFRSTVVWTTPLKLPVVQPYKVNHAEMVQTSIQNLALVQPTAADAVDPRKQLQGFPPNFIHSLDATHMMLSALRANELGLSFSAVHDSFWTHAADVASLNTLLREAFIRMHSEDIIGRLAAEFRARYKGHWYLAKIGKNNVLAKAIKRYRIAFTGSSKDIKKQRYSELVREIKKARLLASEDAAERAEGEAMVTAATLFKEHSGERYLLNRASLGQTAIGEVHEADPLAVEQALEADVIDDVNLMDTLDPLLDAEPVETRPTTKEEAGHSIWLWLPLTFRDVPKKGEFEVETVNDSTYFFS